jgi:hypothetical protein
MPSPTATRKDTFIADHGSIREAVRRTRRPVGAAPEGSIGHGAGTVGGVTTTSTSFTVTLHLRTRPRRRGTPWGRPSLTTASASEGTSVAPSESPSASTSGRRLRRPPRPRSSTPRSLRATATMASRRRGETDAHRVAAGQAHLVDAGADDIALLHDDEHLVVRRRPSAHRPDRRPLGLSFATATPSMPRPLRDHSEALDRFASPDSKTTKTSGSVPAGMTLIDSSESSDRNFIP